MRAGRLSPAICHPGIRREDTGHGGGQFNWHKGNSLSERGKVQLDFSPWRDDVPLPGLFLFLSVTWARTLYVRVGHPAARLAPSTVSRRAMCAHTRARACVQRSHALPCFPWVDSTSLPRAQIRSPRRGRPETQALAGGGPACLTSRPVLRCPPG